MTSSESRVLLAWPLLLGAVLIAGCGDAPEAACPCRAPLVCVAGTCEMPDGAVDLGTPMSADVGMDTSGDAGPSSNHDTGSDGASHDTAPDVAPDVPEGGSPNTNDDATDGAIADATDDAIADAKHVPDDADNDLLDDARHDVPPDAPPETTDGAPDGLSTDGSSTDGGAADATSPEAGSAPDAGPRGEPSRAAVLHVFATTDTGGLWLMSATISSLHGPVGYIGQTVDVRARAGSIGRLDDVEAQSIGNEVNVIARQGSDVFATSVVGQTWTPWAKVTSGVNAMALANLTGQLWACLAGSNGRLRLVTRQSIGWQDLGDVMNEASLPPGTGEAPTALAKLDCVGVGDSPEIFALDPNGGLWHATKTPTRWIQFLRMPDASGRGFRDIDVSNSLGEIHVLGSSQTGQLHGTFDADGTWSGFGDLINYLNDPSGDILAGAQAAILAEVDWIQVTTLGEIWLSPRFRGQLNNYEMYIDRAPDDSPFVTVSATSVLPY